MTETQAVQEAVEEIAQHSGALGKVGLLAGGLIVGAASGYYVAKRRLEKKYLDQAEAEIAEMRELYSTQIRASAATRVANDEVDGLQVAQTIIEAAKYDAPPVPKSEMHEAFQDQHHDQHHDHDPEILAAEEAEAEIVSNVFNKDDEDVWEWGEEKYLRENGADPYVLHKDEWLTADNGWVRTSLTYFEGDDVLADDHDTPNDDQDALVGLVNLQKFGHGSGDPNVVYVRNVELQMEFEIVRSEGKFSEQRRGIVQPPADQSDPRRRRNRGLR